MTAPIIAALICSVVLLVITAYFLMGSVPLLILQHDTPVDSRFVRGFFNTYYIAATGAATATAVSFAFAGRTSFALGAALLALLTWSLRQKVIGKMDSLGMQIQSNDSVAIPGFRRTHLTAIAINLVQLAVVVWSLTTFQL